MWISSAKFPGIQPGSRRDFRSGGPRFVVADGREVLGVFI